MMDNFITYFFSYVGFSMLGVSLLLSSISMLAHRKQLTISQGANTALMYLLLFCAGMAFLWEATFYAAMPQTAAVVQGYLPSPFEWQISAAYIGIALVGMIGAFSTKRFRIAAIVLTSAVMWGQAFARIYLATVTEIDHTLAENLNVASQIITPLLLIMLHQVSKRENHSTNETSNQTQAPARA